MQERLIFMAWKVLDGAGHIDFKGSLFDIDGGSLPASEIFTAIFFHFEANLAHFNQTQ